MSGATTAGASRPSLRRALAVVLGAAAIAVSACGATDAGSGDRPEFPLQSSVAAYARTHGIPIEGIELPKDASAVTPGDTMTAIATLEDGEARQQWLIRLKVVPRTDAERASKPPVPITIPVDGHPFEFGTGTPVAVEIFTAGPFDGGAPQEKTARAVIASDLLAAGFTPFAETALRLQKTASGRSADPKAPPTVASDEDKRSLASGLSALFSLFTVVRTTPGLAELFWRVAEKPSLWSLVKAGSHAGVMVGTDGPVSEIDAVPWRVKGARLYRIHFIARFGDKPMLESNLIVGPSHSPLSATAGVVGITAVSASAKPRRLEVRLLAAHRAQ